MHHNNLTDLADNVIYSWLEELSGRWQVIDGILDVLHPLDKSGVRRERPGGCKPVLEVAIENDIPIVNRMTYTWRISQRSSGKVIIRILSNVWCWQCARRRNLCKSQQVWDNNEHGHITHILVGHSGLYQLTVYLTESPRQPLHFVVQRNRWASNLSMMVNSCPHL